LAILLRHGFPFNNGIFLQCLLPFSIIFLTWLVLFSISHLYELRYAANRKKFFEMVFKLFSLAAIISVIYFYLFVPSFAPKKILFLTIIFSFILFLIWRVIFNRIIKIPRINVLIISKTREASEINMFLKKHPQIGYDIIKVLSSEEINQTVRELKENEIDLFVIDSNLFDSLLSYVPNARLKLKVVDIIDFYESVLQKTPVDLLSPSWFLENYYSKNWQLYETLKRILDIFGGIMLFIFSLPLWPIIALLIALDSKGIILYKSVRIGSRDNEFYIYKFRTMFDEADKIGPSWTLENDPRITRVGKILRFLHLDEIPQVLNIIKGDVSFVGPRPEEEKLVNLFKKKIPFYQFRLLVKPGVIGWAQINYPHSSSVEDAHEKLKYDFYYLKHRNIFFDIIVALKAWRIPFEIPTH
jgi:exopolysaccharide biosynthesis polyprenyl glycosylphosphotransferase